MNNKQRISLLNLSLHLNFTSRKSNKVNCCYRFKFSEKLTYYNKTQSQSNNRFYIEKSILRQKTPLWNNVCSYILTLIFR